MNTTTPTRFLSRMLCQTLILSAGLTLLLGTACSKRTSTETAINDATSKMGDTLSSAFDGLKNATFDQRASISETLGKATDGMQLKASEWGSKLSSLTGDARTSAQSALSDLNSALADVKSKLGGVSSASAGSWDNIRTGLMSAWKKAQDSYTKVASAFASKN